MQVIKFKEWDCVLDYSTYMNGRTAIQLNDLEDGMPIATATVNIPEAKLESNEVIIKNYSENEGMSKALMDAGIIGPPSRSIRTGHVIVMVHELLSKVNQIN